MGEEIILEDAALYRSVFSEYRYLQQEKRRNVMFFNWQGQCGLRSSKEVLHILEIELARGNCQCRTVLTELGEGKQRQGQERKGRLSVSLKFSA